MVPTFFAQMNTPFCFIEDFIIKKEIKNITFSDLKEIFDKDITQNLENSTKLRDIRELSVFLLLFAKVFLRGVLFLGMVRSCRLGWDQ